MRLTPDYFAKLMAPFAPFEARPVLAVAVSGGRDSLALALLAGEWARNRGGRVVGLIVDHGLRAEAAREAEATRALLAEHGIAAEILSWTGPKPLHGIQAAARSARYALQSEACRRLGILHLLVAHHANDQAETVAMRAAHGSGPDGLAGMAALVELRDLRLLRPLLPVKRVAVTAMLRDRGIVWIDDPSNADPRFERVRIRQAGVAEIAIDDGERTAGERRLARMAVDAVEIDQEAAFDRSLFMALNHDQARGLLSRLVQAVGGRDHPPRRERLDRAVGRLRGPSSPGKSGKSQDFTLSGCRLMLRQAAGTRRLRWIVRHENGTTDDRKRGQPLVPAAFFACGGPVPPHVDWTSILVDRP